jgi:hypothetical protein
MLAWSEVPAPSGTVFVVSNFELTEASWTTYGQIYAVDGATGFLRAQASLPANAVFGGGNVAADAGASHLYATYWHTPTDVEAPTPTTLVSVWSVDVSHSGKGKGKIVLTASSAQPTPGGSLQTLYALGPQEGALAFINGTHIGILTAGA